MKKTFEGIPRLRRITSGSLSSDESAGRNGAFRYELAPKRNAICIVSDQGLWEHVSAHIKYVDRNRKIKETTPTWEEMCAIKDLFWDPDECVIQYHPPKSEYVNLHRHVLHLWKPVKGEIQTPPLIYV